MVVCNGRGRRDGGAGEKACRKILGPGWRRGEQSIERTAALVRRAESVDVE
jgi:hypothetical protein